MPTIADVRKQYPQYSDMSDGQLADALHTKFYADMPRDQFNAKIGLAAPVAPAEKPGLMDKVGAFAQAATEQIPFLDEAVAATAAKVYGGDYEQMRQRQRGLAENDRKVNPGARNAGGIAGFGATVLAPTGGAGLIAKARSLPQAIGRSAAVGAAYGGVTGAGSAIDGKRLEGGTKGAAFGGLVGGGLGPLARLSQTAGKGAAKTASPVLSEIEAAKRAAYQAVDKAKVQYPPAAFAKLATDIETKLGKSNLNPMRTPKAASMVDDISKLAAQRYAPTLTQLDQLRQVVGLQVTSAADKAERQFGRQITDAIDNFIEDPRLSATMVGAKKGADLIGKARASNATYRKLEAVDTAVAKAKDRAAGSGSGGNVDNAIRQNLRAVADKTPGLTSPEKAAFAKAVRGSPSQNLLRAIGKTSPLTGGLTGVVNTVVAGVNPALMPYMLGTSASKLAADAITAQNVEAIRRAIAAGGPSAAAAAKVVKANPGLARAVAQAGIGVEMAGGGLLAPRPTVEVSVPSMGLLGASYGPAGGR